MKTERTDVVVVGGGLTGLTTAYYLKKAGLAVVVLEKAERTGGVIRTFRENGFQFEAGPSTGVLSSTELVQLFDDLTPSVVAEFAGSAAKSRWIWKNRRWNALPSGLVSAVTTPLFTLSDKLRILGEPFRKPGTNPNESVADMVRRRMGRSFLDYAINPFLSGVYAGDPEKLTLRFALPKLYRLEQDYGSFIRGSIQKAREPRTDLQKRVTKGVFSVKGGLQELVDGLAAALNPAAIRTGCSELTIQPLRDGFYTTYTNAKGEHVALESAFAVTAFGSAGLDEALPFLTTSEREVLSSAVYAAVEQVIVGYSSWQGLPLQAFGGLVPSREKRDCLGILFPSSIFAGRTPEGGALLSVFMGGINKPDWFDKTDEELKTMALAEIRNMLQTTQEPDLLKVFRYKNAIPQYRADCEERFAVLDAVEKQYRGLYIAGNIRDGIGMSDRVRQGRTLAEKIALEYKQMLEK